MGIDELADKFRPFHNDICLLYDTDLVRLLGVAEDDWDLYYVVQKLGYGKDRYWASAVGWLVSMKDRLPRYEITENMFTINNCPPNEKFEVIRFHPNIMVKEW